MRRIPLLTCLALVLLASNALANSAPPWTDGAPVGEPLPPLEQVEIVREKLTFDFLRLEDGLRRVGVKAVYHLHNHGKPVATPLVFITPDFDNSSVTLDGKPLITTEVEEVPIPPEWSPPETSPPLGWDEESGGELGYPINYVAWTTGQQQLYRGFQFDIALDKGKHTMSVDYAMTVPTYYHDHPYAYFQVGYVLAPAGSWKSFGKLDLTVKVDPSWEFASSVPLAQEGETWKATFEGLPADTLAFAAHPPLSERVRWLTGIFPMVALGLSLLLGLFSARGLAVSAQKKGRASFAGTFVRAVLAGFFAGLLTFIIHFVAESAALALVNDALIADGWLSMRSRTGFFLMGLAVPFIAAVVFFATFFFNWKAKP